MSINFKVFLHDGENTDVRKFNVDDASVVTNYLFMREKLMTVFPTLRDATFKITWKDSDGDQITITSDEDLITAFTEMNGYCKVLHVTILEKNDTIFILEDEEVPPYTQPMANIICDGCNATITGYRYKCMQCLDYDLCANCEHKGLHAEHVMMRTSQVDFFAPRCGRRFMQQVMRSLKKAQAHAARESFKTAKHAHKASKHQEKEEAKASSSAHAGHSRSSYGPCPVTNVFDYVAPLLEAAFPKPRGEPTNTSTNPNPTTNANDGLPYAPPQITEMVRGAINSFFEGMASAQQQTTQNEKPTSTEKEPEKSAAATPAPTQELPKMYPEVPTKEPTPQYSSNTSVSSPMEVETPAQPASAQPPSAPEVILVDLETPEKPAEPGWTFVSQNLPQPSQSGQNIPKPTGPVDPQNLKIAEGLKQLLEMGFSNELNLVALLKRFDGNVGQVVKYLFENNP